MLPELAIPKSIKDYIDSASIETMINALSKQKLKSLKDIVERFFTKRPVLESTPPRADSKAARVLKTNNEIADAWRLILERRRLVEPNDRRPINDPDTLAWMYTEWMYEWLEKNATDKQRRLRGRERSSIFAAYLNNNLASTSSRQ